MIGIGLAWGSILAMLAAEAILSSSIPVYKIRVYYGNLQLFSISRKS